MNGKIVGVTVTTPMSTRKIAKELRPVKTINGIEPDENGDIKMTAGGGEFIFSTDEEVEDMLGEAFSAKR